MTQNVDTAMSRLCNRLMSAAQSALDTQAYIIEEMEYLASENPDREDIKDCLAEIKAQNKASESKNWTTANNWGEHFDGVSGEKGGGSKPITEITAKNKSGK